MINSNAHGNIGKLINAIKLSCANSLNNTQEKRTKVLKVKINNLPKDIIEQDEDISFNNLNINNMFISCSEKMIEII